MRKLSKTFIFMMLFMAFVCCLNVNKAEAIDYDKKELDTEIVDSLVSTTDVKQYEFQTNQDGYVVIEFTTNGSEDDINQGWDLIVEDKNHSKILDWNIRRDCNTYKLTFGKNEMFYVLISSDDGSKSYSPIDVPFKIIAKQYNPENWECENNDTYSKTNALKAEQKTFGTLWVTDDVDTYKFTTTKSGYTRFKFTIEEDSLNDVKSGWLVEYLDKNQKLIYSTNYRNDNYSRYFNFKKGEIFYIKVSAYDSYYASCPRDVVYSICPEETETTKWELENNDTLSKATKIKTSAYGTIYKVNDYDYYTYSAKKTKKINLQFLLGEGYVNDGFNIYILDKTGNKTLTYYTGITNDFNMKFKVKKGKKYYILVRSQDISYASDAPIDLQYKITLK